jgi:hypothetical protein
MLIPIAGFMVGIVWAAKGGKKGTVGLVCIAVSVLAAFFWFGVLRAGATDTGAYSTV